MKRRLALLFAVTGFAAWSADEPTGKQVYETSCAVCHDGGVPRAPVLSLMKRMSPESVLHSLDNGQMRFVGLVRPVAERKAVAEYVTGKRFGEEEEWALQGLCESRGEFTDHPLDGPHWNGWGVDQNNTRFQSAEMAGLTAEQVPKLKLKWAFGFAGDILAYAQPTVAGGRIFVGSQGRRVYSLDAKTGCTHWAFEAESSVRAAVVIGQVSGADGPRYQAFFGDTRANFYALDAATGHRLWKRKLDEHPNARATGAAKLHEERLYIGISSFEEGTGGQPNYECCKFRGSVMALDAATGKEIWKSYTIPEEPRPVRKNKVGTQLWGPSGAGVWNSPTLDLKRRALYVGTGDNYSDPPNETSDAIIAFDMDTGKMLWSQQFTEGDAFVFACITPDKTNCPEANGPDADFGASPILAALSSGKRVLLAGQKSGTLHALDPDREGEVLWQAAIGKGGVLGGIQWGPATAADTIYVALADPEFELDLESELGLDMILSPEAGGGLFAYQISTGERIWHTPPAPCGNRKPCSPAQSAAVTVTPGVVFSGSMDGHLRAYATRDGKVLWKVDTFRDYETVNGVAANGGSLDAAGPVVVDGMLYVNSGYGFFGGKPGNVLLAFSVDGK